MRRHPEWRDSWASAFYHADVECSKLLVDKVHSGSLALHNEYRDRHLPVSDISIACVLLAVIARHKQRKCR